MTNKVFFGGARVRGTKRELISISTLIDILGHIILLVDGQNGKELWKLTWALRMSK